VPHVVVDRSVDWSTNDSKEESVSNESNVQGVSVLVQNFTN
jgi:hypothetical protein